MKRSIGEKVFNVVNIIFMLLLCVVTLYPYLNQLAISFNEGLDAMSGGIYLLPRKFTFENYRAVFSNPDFLSATVISVLRVVIATFLALTVVFSAAYGLTRRNLPYKRAITLFLMIPAYITAGVIPIYMLYRYLHLINSFFVYIFPTAFSFYNMVIIRSFLQELPASIEESAAIDGANSMQTMIKIILPMSLPVLATVTLWVAVGAWNDWTTTLMYVTEKDLFPLQYLMMRLIKESEIAQQMAANAAMLGATDDTVVQTTSESVKSATMMVSTLPIIAIYPFLQKYFIKGVVMGAVKE